MGAGVDGLSLRQVRYFLTVADELHVGRAASRLHLSQPALSQQLRRLEHTLGVALFTRSGRGIQLSPAGTALLPAARHVLAAATELSSSAARAGRAANQQLAIGLLADGALELTPRILRSFRATHPNATFTLTRYDFTDPSAGLSTGETDVAFVRLPFTTHGLQIVPLFDEPRAAVLPDDHPLADQDQLSVHQLLDQTWCCVPVADPVWRNFWQATTHRRGQPPRLTPPTTNFEEMLETVAAGQGIAVVSASTERLYPRPGLRLLPIPDLETTTAAVARRQDDTNPLAHAFLEVARDIADQLAPTDVPGVTAPSRTG